MGGLEADTEAISKAVQHARDKITAIHSQAMKDQPTYPVAAAGQGFAERGKRLAEALERVQQGTVDRLEARLRHFEKIAAANGDIKEGDDINAEELNRHDIS